MPYQPGAMSQSRQSPTNTLTFGTRLDGLKQPWAKTLGHLLDYHRREAKPEWWAYFEQV